MKTAVITTAEHMGGKRTDIIDCNTEGSKGCRGGKVLMIPNHKLCELLDMRVLHPL